MSNYTRRLTMNYGGLGCLVFVIIMIASWFTHVLTCLDEERWGFLIAGAIMFPIAIVHGIGIWFGVW